MQYKVLETFLPYYNVVRPDASTAPRSVLDPSAASPIGVHSELRRACTIERRRGQQRGLLQGARRNSVGGHDHRPARTRGEVSCVVGRVDGGIGLNLLCKRALVRARGLRVWRVLRFLS